MQAQGETSEQFQEDIIEQLQRQVDELTAANLLLQEQQAHREQLTAMIAHDLRAPLAPIINYAQMLARHNCEPQENSSTKAVQRNGTIARHTSVIISQAHRMSRLVNDLLDASQLSSSQFSLRCGPCDIVALAKEMLEQLRPVAPYHILVIQAPDRPIIGNWDGGRLQQALGNLLDNAIKYSDEHTTITVTVRMLESKDCAYVSVHNMGASIPSADIGQLFLPYIRLPATSNRQGSGLGLFITKSIIEAHGGMLRLEPYSEDGSGESQRGTTFTFELPLHASVPPSKTH
ncbi:MAG TPA: HAMP domain-containing sensor histidine kinase [Ktedonobacteraceae bacterium]